MEFETLNELFFAAMETHRKPDVIRYKSEGAWHSVSWAEMLERVRDLALGFHELGVKRGDGEKEIRYIADKILGLRVFPDEQYPMNVSLKDVRGEVLVVSQFTLYGDCRRGRRPSFDEAELPHRAEEIYSEFVEYLAREGCPPRQGVFGASMLVTLENEGPVTIILDSEKKL